MSGLALDGDGHLLPSQPWNEAVARELAAQEGLDWQPQHLQLALALRDFVREVGREPTQRAFASWLKTRMPQAQVGSLQLRRLFPGGPLRQCARVAGLPLPRDCLTAAERLRRDGADKAPREADL